MKNSNKIYVLHEFGANSHYLGLQEHCDTNSIKLFYKEFTCIKPFFKSVFKFNIINAKNHFINILFMLNLFFTKNKTIILGAAPYDRRIVYFNYLAKKHSFYYHTSWTKWNGDYVPKNFKNQFLLKQMKEQWKCFLEERCKGIFCVTNEVKDQIQLNYNIEESFFSTVYHSIDDRIFNFKDHQKEESLNIIFIGRLVKEKGIDELIDLINISDSTINFGIIGQGTYRKDDLISISKKHNNVQMYGYIEREDLGGILNKYDIIICPSKKIKGTVW